MADMNDDGQTADGSGGGSGSGVTIGDVQLAETGTTCLSAAYDASQGVLALGYSTGHVRLQQLENGRDSTFTVSNAGLSHVLLPASLGVLVVADTQGTLWVFDTRTQRTCFQYRVPGERQVSSVCWVSGTHWVCVGTSDGRSYFVDVVRGRKSDFSLGGMGRGKAVSVSCHPVESEKVLVAYAAGECCVFDLGRAAVDEQSARVAWYAADGPLVDAVWSPDGRRIACAHADGAVSVFDVPDGKPGKQKRTPAAANETLHVERPGDGTGQWRVARILWLTDPSDAVRLLAVSTSEQCAWVHMLDDGRTRTLDGGPAAAVCMVAQGSPWRNGSQHVRALVVAGGSLVRHVAMDQENKAVAAAAVERLGRVAAVQAAGGAAVSDGRSVWTAGGMVAHVGDVARAVGVRGDVCALAWADDCSAAVGWDSGEACVLSACGVSAAAGGAVPVDAASGAAEFYAQPVDCDQSGEEESAGVRGRRVRSVHVDGRPTSDTHVRSASVGGLARRRSSRLASLGQRLLFRRTAPSIPADTPRAPPTASAWQRTQQNVRRDAAHMLHTLAPRDGTGVLAPAAVLRLCRRAVRCMAVRGGLAAVAYMGGTLAVFDWHAGQVLLADNPGIKVAGQGVALADVCRPGAVEITHVAFIDTQDEDDGEKEGWLLVGTACGWVLRYSLGLDTRPPERVARPDVHAPVLGVSSAPGCVVVCTAAGVTAYSRDMAHVVGRHAVDALLAAAPVNTAGWQGVAALDRHARVTLLRLPSLDPVGPPLAVHAARMLARHPAVDAQISIGGLLSLVLPRHAYLRVTLRGPGDLRGFFDAERGVPEPPERRTLTSWLFARSTDPAPDIDGFLGARFRDLIAHGAGTRPSCATPSPTPQGGAPTLNGGVLRESSVDAGAFAGLRALAERRGQRLNDAQEAADRANAASADYLAEIRAYNARQEKKAKLFGLF